MGEHTKESFIEISKLIKINFAEQEINDNLEQMSRVFDWIDSVKEIVVPDELLSDNADIWDQDMLLKQGCRGQDAVSDGGYAEDVLRNAGSKEYGYFRVPKVL